MSEKIKIILKKALTQYLSDVNTYHVTPAPVFKFQISEPSKCES